MAPVFDVMTGRHEGTGPTTRQPRRRRVVNAPATQEWRERAVRRAVRGMTSEAEPAARRVLVLHDQTLLVELIELTLNHGIFEVHGAATLGDADSVLARWSPDLAVIDMDHEDGPALMQRLGVSNSLRQNV